MASRIGDLLVQLGALTTEQLEKAESVRQAQGGLICGSVVKLGLISEDDLLNALAQHYGLPTTKLEDIEVNETVSSLIPGDLCNKHYLFPLELKSAIISRLKIMADLDIAERRLPQDGRIKLKLGNRREMDFRVSVLPGLFGEKVVLRLLDKSNLQTDMLKLGFMEDQLNAFKEAIEKPYGLVLVTGPTGSGKTTTLYSGLSELNKTTVNISTAEDPVEFNLHGINQVQMHDDIGLNFAAALRSFLRQDPDVIMVGEIRDYETAEIAIKASMTGHLVLSTLHTNDAPSTINRLLNMGIEPFLVASSVNIVVAQRLARRICSGCKEVFEISPEVLINIGLSPAEAKHTVVHYGKGCSKCSGTGYKGRVAFYETMVMTEELKDFVLNGASAAEIKREAARGGMLTLRASGLHYLKEGVTTIEEVLRVTVAD